MFYKNFKYKNYENERGIRKQFNQIIINKHSIDIPVPIAFNKIT